MEGAANKPTISSTKQFTTKGSCARFLCQNPRFINEPIRHLLPEENSQSVSECMNWSAMEHEQSHRRVIRERPSTCDNEM